ncbi:dihydrolipoyl dehydrogenase [Shimia sp. Alg240-R146]|uniref:dihydrolipoyl dehydrogenase n=1 Tax=Shimia sp. Alg240-R146 TaxID=2993449 RepID=UPI0022E3B97A|nr:dihydrolipoyl dehydrogenase [Shimia sp. Alg240-R146]
MSQYDVIIIGAGPGGYVSAIRCAQLGLKTAIVEGRETLGGTCLNIGCIPSKALLHATHMLHEAEHNFASMGLKGKTQSVDWNQMKSYKQDVVSQNTSGVDFLMKKNKITVLKGWASIPAAGQVKVGDDVHATKNIVIASGSVPSSLPGVEVDNDKGIVVDSTGALELPKVPKKMAVIGAGVIGLELGSVYARLGADVTVVEYMDAVCPGMDADVQRTFKRILEKQGLKFVMGAAVSGVETTKTKAKVKYATKKAPDTEEVLDADVVLVATGRKPYAEGLGLDALGVKLTERGQIATDAKWATNVPGVYAIGDVIEGPMLAHKAEDEGMAVAEVLAGKHGHVNYGVIPGVVYTTPEVATVGATEAALKAEGRKIKVGKFNFMGNGRAKAVHQGEGFVKLIVDKETDRILGAAIIGPGAGDLIHEICVGMEFGASAQDIALTCHAHPTFSEAVREAALACGDGAIHS